jgi:hypothetical protein
MRRRGGPGGRRRADHPGESGRESGEAAGEILGEVEEAEEDELLAEGEPG